MWPEDFLSWDNTPRCGSLYHPEKSQNASVEGGSDFIFWYQPRRLNVLRRGGKWEQ